MEDRRELGWSDLSDKSVVGVVNADGRGKTDEGRCMFEE